MAEQAAATVPAASAFPFRPEILDRLTTKQKLAGMGVVAFAIALLVGVWLWTKEVPYGVLFSNLSPQDGGQIIASLQQQNIPYQFSEGGGAIMVPADMVHDVRLRLASEGLPQGGLVGFELMENQKLGISQFAEQVNYQRGLEGELARSIQTLGAVRAARVHLAIPKQTAFLRDEIKPSASVLVSLHPGRTLDGLQLAGIIHLVSSSVPRLNPSDVSVIDQDGNLISKQNDPFSKAGLDATQLKFVQEIEAQYVRRVEAILEPLVGRGNFRAQVAADIDFSHVEQMDETWMPNPSPETAIRSQQYSDSGSGVPPAFGVPGALTNQPPVPATAPITVPPVGGAGDEGAANNNFTRSATINYELDKTVRHTRAKPGAIRRLSVAVAVNHRPGVVEKGVQGSPVPLSAEEIERINTLVREAVGFSAARGDTISVASASFVVPEPELIPPLPLWQDPAAIALAREIAQYALIGLIALLVWFKLVKPVVRMLTPQPEPAPVDAQAGAEPTGEEEIDLAPKPPTFEERLKQARETAQKDPKVVAELLKEWMGAGET